MPATSAKRVCSQGSTAAAAPSAAQEAVLRSRSGTARAETSAMTIMAPGASGNTMNAWRKNGTESAAPAQPTHAADALPVTRHAVSHSSAAPSADRVTSQATTAG